MRQATAHYQLTQTRRLKRAVEPDPYRRGTRQHHLFNGRVALRGLVRSARMFGLSCEFLNVRGGRSGVVYEPEDAIAPRARQRQRRAASQHHVRVAVRCRMNFGDAIDLDDGRAMDA